jgi:hypothetical protein
MSRHVNTTKLLVVTATVVVFACSTDRASRTQAPTVLRVNHCVGDVVPLCASVRVTETGLMEYVRHGKATLRGRLTESEADELRDKAGVINVASWSDNEDPIGSFVTFEVPSGTRTIQLIDLPADAMPVLQFVDRVGQRVFGRAYRSITGGLTTR